MCVENIINTKRFLKRVRAFGRKFTQHCKLNVCWIVYEYKIFVSTIVRTIKIYLFSFYYFFRNAIWFCFSVKKAREISTLESLFFFYRDHAIANFFYFFSAFCELALFVNSYHFNLYKLIAHFMLMSFLPIFIAYLPCFDDLEIILYTLARMKIIWEDQINFKLQMTVKNFDS